LSPVLIIGLSALLSLGILALAVIAAGRGKAKKERNYLIARAQDPLPPKRRLRGALLWAALCVALILALLAFIAPGRQGGGDGRSASASGPLGPGGEEPGPQSVVSQKFDDNPLPPTETELLELARLELEEERRIEAEKARLEALAARGLGPDDGILAEAEAGLGFAPVPEELVIIGAPMAQGARDFAPKISRMEPLGRSLDPDKAPPPRGQVLEPGSQPPEKERPRLSPPKPREDPPKPPPKPLSERRYTIIAASFTKEGNAKSLVDKFLAEGLNAEIALVSVDNKTFYRVTSGTFDDKESAEAYCRELRQRELSSQPYIMAM
jgi:cell division septation protein DedD